MTSLQVGLRERDTDTGIMQVIHGLVAFHVHKQPAISLEQQLNVNSVVMITNIPNCRVPAADCCGLKLCFVQTREMRMMMMGKMAVVVTMMVVTMILMMMMVVTMMMTMILMMMMIMMVVVVGMEVIYRWM